MPPPAVKPAVQPTSQAGPRAYERWRSSRLGSVTKSLEQTCILDLVGPVEGRRLLDLGCGDGLLMWTLADRGARAVGIDADRAILDAASARSVRSQRQRPRLVEGRIEQLPFPDASFDVVVIVTGCAWWPTGQARFARPHAVNVCISQRFRGDLTQFLHSSQLHLFVYEPLFVDVRRRLAGTRVGWTRLLCVQRSPEPLNVQRQSPRRRFIAQIAGVAYAEALQGTDAAARRRSHDLHEGHVRVETPITGFRAASAMKAAPSVVMVPSQRSHRARGRASTPIGG